MGDSMDLKQYDEIIKFAIEKEIGAFNFYVKASQVAKYSGARELFIDFSKEEEKHRKLLEDITVEKIAQLKVDQAVPDLKISDYMVDVEFRPDLSYADILRMAMKMEERSLKLYTDLKETTTVQEIHRLFDFLAQQEAKHKYSLEMKYDEDILR
jgi:rubrerythrin